MSARVLLYDVESAPIKAYVWRLYNIDRVTAMEDDWFLLSVAWKWLGDKRVRVLSLDQTARTHPMDDFGLASRLQALFDEADVVIAHNGDQFDQAKARTKMSVHNLTPPSPFREIDTLKVARRHFAFSSNTLDALGTALDLGNKMPTGGFDLWKRCMENDPKAWAKMRRYNRSDVDLLEKVYLRLRPWIPNHPNLALMAERPDACPRCEAEGTLTRQGWRPRGTTRVPRFQCTACGGWSQGRIADKLRPHVTTQAS